jgi:site-specific recombinase XerD
MLALGYGAGLRRAEIAALDIGDARIDGENIAVKVRHAKGGRERIVYSDNGARCATGLHGD